MKDDDDFSATVWLFFAVVAVLLLFVSESRAESAKMPEVPVSEFWQAAKAAGWFATLAFGFAIWWLNGERKAWAERYFKEVDKRELLQDKVNMVASQGIATAEKLTTAINTAIALRGSTNA